MDVHGWMNTRAALSDLEVLLICGVCNQMVRQPCTMGGCEHIFCQVCVEDFKGSVCPMCGVPSHVKDVQTDRQLGSAATLCRQLARLVNSNEISASSGSQGAAVTPDQQLNNNAISVLQDPDIQDLAHLASVTDSPLNTTPISCRTRRNVKVKKKKEYLVQTNITWGIGREETDKCLSCKKSRQRVLFNDRSNQRSGSFSEFCEQCDEIDSSGDVHDKVAAPGVEFAARVEIEADEVSEKLHSSGKPGERNVGNTQKEQAEKSTNHDSTVRSKRRNKEADCDVVKTDAASESQDYDIVPETYANTEQEAVGTSSPKLRKSKNTRKGKKKNTRNTRENHTQKQTSPPAAVVNESSSTPKPTAKTISKSSATSNTGLACTPRSSSRGQHQPWVSPSCGRSVSTPVSRLLGTSFTSSPSLTGSPAISKKNPKGETPLHVACIKGDTEKVRQLLSEGASTNARDHAGWTPLHEACNHGNTSIAGLLLDDGAVINAVGGPDNDSPLHDAVFNYRIHCIQLLVSRGANVTQRNLLGKTPMDLATNDAMKKALRTPVNTESANKTLTEPSASQDIQHVVVIATGLDREQKNRVQKCAQMLHGKMQTDFSPTVSHVITSVNDKGMCPRTLKYLHAVLAGKWVVNMDWVETCLEYKERISEEPFEVPGASSSPNSMAPNRARNNHVNQLPGLFSGCQFFLRGDFEYPAPTREDLTGLIKAASGLIVTREPRLESIVQSELTVPYHVTADSQLEHCSHFIIQDKIKCGKLIDRRIAQVPPSWIMDCIAQFKITDFMNTS